MAASIAKSAAKKLGNLAVDEAKYLYKIGDKIESLQAELQWMECFLRDADTQQHKEKVIYMWVSQVRDHAYEAEDIIQKYLHNVSHHRHDGFKNALKWFACILYTCDAYTLHKLGSDIEDLTANISELTSRLQRYGIQINKPTRSTLEYHSMSREERRTYSHIEEDVVGLKEDIKKVRDELFKKNNNVVSISGTGGLGKTTLARKVFLDNEVKQQYVCVWVYISQEFEKIQIFQEILAGLEKSEGPSVTELGELPRKIDELLKNKKCFVVLDDIWSVDAWKRLEPAFQSIKNSPSKILLTTRTQNLLQHVDPSGYLHPLQPLSQNDSWILLKRKAFIRQRYTGGESSHPSQNESQGEPSSPPNKNQPKDIEALQKLGEEMLKHCCGIPLAILALGGILSTKKTITEWKAVQKNIGSYLMDDTRGYESARIREVVELSYQDLPFYLKPCFLYMGSFPEDFEISVQRLYHLWGAEGLLEGEGNAEIQEQTSYDVGERYLNELIQRSMIQVGECRSNGMMKTCKVHDVMRDMCLKKAKEINFLNIIEHTKSTEYIVEQAKSEDLASALASCCSAEHKKVRRCVVHWKGYDAEKGLVKISKLGKEKKRGTCVRSILVLSPEIDGTRWLSQKTWKYFTLVRVLDFERVAITGVFKGVEYLIHLRYLSLRRTGVTKLPLRFCDLKSMETLDLRSKVCMKLDGYMLQSLERLRHLYLPKKFKLVRGTKLHLPVRGRMETLKNFDPLQCEIDDLLTMTSLRIFTITEENYFEKTDDLIRVLKAPAMKLSGQLTNTVRLSIDGYILSDEPTILSSLPRPPCSFSLLVARPDGPMLKDVANRSIGCVSNLEKLELHGESLEIGAADVLALGKLPHLQSLVLYRVAISGSKMTFSAGSFPSLNYLNLDSVYDLKDWEVKEGALINLGRLRVCRCENLKKLPCGLSPTIDIACYYPCIRGIEKYNTCPHFRPNLAEYCYRRLV